MWCSPVINTFPIPLLLLENTRCWKASISPEPWILPSFHLSLSPMKLSLFVKTSLWKMITRRNLHLSTSSLFSLYSLPTRALYNVLLRSPLSFSSHEIKLEQYIAKCTSQNHYYHFLPLYILKQERLDWVKAITYEKNRYNPVFPVSSLSLSLSLSFPPLTQLPVHGCVYTG